MNRQDALRYLMFERTPNVDASKRFGVTPIVRSVQAWEVAYQLSSGDEVKITTEVLDQIMAEVESGADIIDKFRSGQFKSMLDNAASGNASGP